MRYITLAISFVIIFVSCEQNKTSTDKECCNDSKSNNNHLTFATIYQQHAPEYKALCIQAYNTAKKELEDNVLNAKFEKAPAIILDLDETVLDNSPYEAKCILDNINYPEKWEEWINKANAGLIPGAEDFLNFAKNNDIEIYYISNRKNKYIQQTINNLKLHNLPYADSLHILLRKDSSSKKSRRAKVLETKSIVMLIGDNLNDFTDLFELETNELRSEKVEEFSSLFGSKYIILPNPMYGEWEKAILNGSYKHSKEERDSLYKTSLIDF